MSYLDNNKVELNDIKNAENIHPLTIAAWYNSAKKHFNNEGKFYQSHCKIIYLILQQNKISYMFLYSKLQSWSPMPLSKKYCIFVKINQVLHLSIHFYIWILLDEDRNSMEGISSLNKYWSETTSADIGSLHFSTDPSSSAAPYIYVLLIITRNYKV